MTRYKINQQLCYNFTIKILNFSYCSRTYQEARRIIDYHQILKEMNNM